MASSIPLNCQVCCKTFSGAIPAQQHYSSQEHKRKMDNSRMEKPGLTCVVCHVNCDTQKIMEQHVQSPRHLAMAEKQRNRPGCDTDLATGSLNYFELISNQREAYEFDVLCQRGSCNLCDVCFTSSSHAQSHLHGKSHRKKLVNFEASNAAGSARSIRESSFGASTSTSPNQHQLSTNHLAAQSSAVTPLVRTTINQKCNICQVFFSGPENAQQHYNSMKHTKKLNDGIGTKPVYSCSLCEVSFTGPENEKTHKLSQKHKKHLSMIENMKIGEELPLSCNACGCEFNGQENAETHFASQKHRQNSENINRKSGGIGGSLTDLERSHVQHTQSRPTPESVTIATGKERQPVRVIAPVAVRPKATQTTMQQEGSGFVNYCLGTPVNERHDPNQYYAVARVGRSNDSKDVESYAEQRDIPFTTTEQGIHPHVESLVVKHVEDDDGNLVNPDERECVVQNRDSEDESLDIKAIETVDATTFNSLYDEFKIKVETNTSITQSLDACSSGLRTEDCSCRDIETVRYVQNDLGLSVTPLGRGRGIFGMLQQQAEIFPGKVVNIDGRSNDDSANADAHHDASETLRKSYWIGTCACPKLEIPISTENTGIGSNIVLSTFLDETGKPNVSNLSTAESHTHTEHVRNTDGNNEIPAFLNEDTGILNASSSPVAQTSNIIEASIYRRMSSDATGLFNIGYEFDNSLGRGICHICDIAFTSRKHMTQHIEGKNHMKARELRRQLEAASELADSPYVCNICTVTFSGYESREQHMQSEKHKHKERRHLTGENENEHYCDICKITCSGSENYQQHLIGAQHRKMSGISTVKESVQQTPTYNDAQWYHCEVCKCSLNTNEQLKIHEQSPKHINQLEKQLPGGIGNIGLQNLVGDRTQWYPCTVCSCSMNTYEQLMIHEKSPKHLKQLEKQNVCGNILTQDRTVWYPCQICNCSLNTPEQFRKHEASPAHISKLQKFGATSYSPARSDIISEDMMKNRQTNTCATPLDTFLSEELFPEQFLPISDKSVERKDDAVSRKLVEDKVQLTYVSNETGIITSSPSEEGTGGANHRNCSDLAWATRSRGTRDNNSKKTSAGSSPSECIDLQGARPKQTNMNHTIFNPYAATHSYYCHTCKSPSNTRESYENHLRGKRHMQKVCTEPAPHRAHHVPSNLSLEYLPFTQTHARNYQRELYKKAMEDDSLCFLPTGTGKTLVAVMAMSAMLDKYASKNVLFLVDKVLLVLQQSNYIRNEIGDREYERFNPDSDTCMDLHRRTARIASVCMGQQTTAGIPLWQHDVVVVTAAFCKNLLDKEILRWEDFSLVIFDEAHHCEKGHPFNSLLTNYHRPSTRQSRPKILGLTASPAGKGDVPKTLQMLQCLVANMGDVKMTIVEERQNVDTLNEYQSNAKMIIRPQLNQNDVFESRLSHEFNVYITHCVIKLWQISNIQHYVAFDYVGDMADEIVRRVANDFVGTNIDSIQSSLNLIQNTNTDKVKFSLFRVHVQFVCMALSCLEEGGPLVAKQELEDMDTESNFKFAREFGMLTAPLQQLLAIQDRGLSSCGQGNEASSDMHLNRLIDELTDVGTFSGNVIDAKRISLVLVKQRCTAYLITRVLQNSEKMKRLGLNTTVVVGHGGCGAADRGMNVNQQKRVLEEIKQFKYQVIIATSVAEEGVDWPECERVISMYPPSTVTALVQMRGRARKKNSKFIVLCSSLEEEDKLQDIMQKESNMIIATRMMIEQSRQH